MLPSPILLATMLLSVLFYRKAGKMADADAMGGHKRITWPAASLGLWMVALLVADTSLFGALFLQLGLFLSITLRDTYRSHARSRRHRREIHDSRDLRHTH